MHFANCAAHATILFTTSIKNLRLCSSAEARIVLNLFLNFKQKMSVVFLQNCSYKKIKVYWTKRLRILKILIYLKLKLSWKIGRVLKIIIFELFSKANIKFICRVKVFYLSLILIGQRRRINMDGALLVSLRGIELNHRSGHAAKNFIFSLLKMIFRCSFIC